MKSGNSTQEGNESFLSVTGVQDLREAVANDVSATRKEYLFGLPNCVSYRLVLLLHNPKDTAIAYLFMNILLTTVPAAIVVFYLNNNIAGILYVVFNYAVYLQRFLLALHYSEHRPLFAQFTMLNQIAPYVLAPLFGVPSGMYSLHHCIMHHTGNNIQSKDLSSTEPFARDSIPHFLLYWLRFAVLGLIELPVYAVKSKRWGTVLHCLLTEALSACCIYKLWHVNPVGTFWIFIAPFLISTLALMLGNWSQHIFINPDCPSSCFSNTYICVDCPDNSKTFNDGYHVIHHLNSRLHWSEFPNRCLAKLNEAAKNRTLIFRGIGFFDVGVSVFLGNFEYLSEHLLRYSTHFESLTDDEIVKELRRRLMPVTR